MREMNIARIILRKRKEKGLTQEEIACYIGVSKASVSKWETGQSYPDITFLPELAALFNISIDELMGYEPQMTKKDIRDLYIKLSSDFSVLPLDEVLNHCLEISKKYFSCFPLLFQIGALLVNHSALSKDADKTEKILMEAKDLFARVKSESDDIELIKQALNMEALCLLTLGRPNEVLLLIDPADLSLTSPEPLLAAAYQMTGRIREAKRIYQIGIYEHGIGLFNLLTSYQKLCLDDSLAYKETDRRILALEEAFQLKTLHPGILMTYYITAAQDHMALGDTEKTLDLLVQYEELVTRDIYPLRLHGDRYFTLLDDWFDDNLALGGAPPRDDKIIRRSITEAVADNPVFTPLAGNPRFEAIRMRLKENEKD